jgi:hypothetical protein
MRINIESNWSNHPTLQCRQVNIQGTRGIEVVFHNNHWYTIAKAVLVAVTTQLDLNQVTLTLESKDMAYVTFTKMNFLKSLPKLNQEDIKAELKKISKWCLTHDDPAIRTGVNSQIVNLLKKVK